MKTVKELLDEMGGYHNESVATQVIAAIYEAINNSWVMKDDKLTTSVLAVIKEKIHECPPRHFSDPLIRALTGKQNSFDLLTYALEGEASPVGAALRQVKSFRQL